MVVKYSDMTRFMEHLIGDDRLVRDGFYDVGEIRTYFFFGEFYRELSLQSEVEIYAAYNARIPQIKFVMKNSLRVDISFAVVRN